MHNLVYFLLGFARRSIAVLTGLMCLLSGVSTTAQAQRGARWVPSINMQLPAPSIKRSVSLVGDYDCVEQNVLEALVPKECRVTPARLAKKIDALLLNNFEPTPNALRRTMLSVKNEIASTDLSYVGMFAQGSKSEPYFEFIFSGSTPFKSKYTTHYTSDVVIDVAHNRVTTKTTLPQHAHLCTGKTDAPASDLGFQLINTIRSQMSELCK